MWNVETFSYIKNHCGGLREAGHNTKNFLNLSEARIQVNASIASSTPPVLQVKINADWYLVIIILFLLLQAIPNLMNVSRLEKWSIPSITFNDNSSIVRGLTELILGEKMGIDSDKFAPFSMTKSSVVNILKEEASGLSVKGIIGRRFQNTVRRQPGNKRNKNPTLSN